MTFKLLVKWLLGDRLALKDILSPFPDVAVLVFGAV
jgi:hypothetical protein